MDIEEAIAVVHVEMLLALARVVDLRNWWDLMVDA